MIQEAEDAVFQARSDLKSESSQGALDLKSGKAQEYGRVQEAHVEQET